MSFAFFPLYTGDYIRDTRHLSCSEHGIYLQLLMFCWDQKGPVPLDERRICGIVNARSGDEIEALRRVLADFFIKMEDGWYNHRLQSEIQKSESISSKRAEAGRLGGVNRAMKKIKQASAKQLPSNCQASDTGGTHPHPYIKPKTSSSSSDDGFDNFWKAYPKKVGKEAARKAWLKLRNKGEALALILVALEWQKKSEQWAKDGGQFIPNPSTYINQGRWMDEPQLELAAQEDWRKDFL